MVCPRCNNGWMSRLETAVQPILRPLVLGKHARLTEDEITTLATWATKTALVYEPVHPAAEGTTASTDDRRWFAHQAPLPHSGVWLARYGTGVTIVRRNTLFLFDLDDPVRRPEPHGLVTGLIFGQVALRVAIVRFTQTGEQRSVVGPQRRARHLSAEHRHLVMENNHFDRETRGASA